MYELASTMVGLIRIPVGMLFYFFFRLVSLLNNHRSRASNPGLIRLSHAKLKRLCPEFFAFGIDPIAWFDQIAGERAIRIFAVADQLIHGDSRAAVVMSVSPLLVAAYTDELDCIAMLHFPDEFVSEHNLRVRSRLLTVNRYFRYGRLPGDLENGPLSYNRYPNFQPFIADFLSNDTDRILSRKAKVREDEWIRAWVLGKRYLAKFGNRARDGSPSYCDRPAEVAGSPTSE